MGLFNLTAGIWPSSIIPYEIDGFLASNPAIVSEIQAGMNMWSSACPFLNFVPRIPFFHQNWVRFVASTYSPTTCTSRVGMQGGEQRITCHITTTITARTIAHEIGHALGLRHEHQRPDRNNFVDFNPFIGYYLDGARPIDYEIFFPPFNIQLGSYDCTSIMHYFMQTWNGIAYFAANSGCSGGIGGISISMGDAAAITSMYT